MMKPNFLSIITVCLNSEETIISCLESVSNQKFKNLEHIVIDGQSTDKTCELVHHHMKNINIKFISEPDNGIYEALNKGIQLASGEIIGILHANDQFYDSNTLQDIIDSHNLFNWDVLHGDLVFETKDGNGLQSRVWKSSDFKIKNLKFGWMPPHPTMFIKRDLINQIGSYNTSFKISGDYDFIWRLYKKKSIKSFYLPRYITRMQLGGISNGSLKNLILKYKEDYKIVKQNTRFPLLCLFLKNISKIHQIFVKA